MSTYNIYYDSSDDTYAIQERGSEKALWTYIGDIEGHERLHKDDHITNIALDYLQLGKISPIDVSWADKIKLIHSEPSFNAAVNYLKTLSLLE